MTKNIATIGAFQIEAKAIRLLSDDNFSEQSLIILDPNSVATEVGHTGNPASQTIHTKFNQRLNALSEWVADGNCLIIVLIRPKLSRFSGWSCSPNAAVQCVRPDGTTAFWNVDDG